MTRSLLFLHAKPGRVGELLRVLERLGVLAMASEQPGFLGVEVAASVEDDDDVVLVGFWSSPAHYERWRAGAVPEQLVAEISSLLATEPVSRLYNIVEAVS